MTKRRRGRDTSGLTHIAREPAPRHPLDDLLTRWPWVSDSVPWVFDEPPVHDLPLVEDRRLFYPRPPVIARETTYRPARRLSGGLARLVVRPTPQRVLDRASTARFVPSAVRFDVPRDVAVCVRRKRRREVLHALKVAGRRGMRRPRRNEYSAISCR